MSNNNGGKKHSLGYSITKKLKRTKSKKLNNSLHPSKKNQLPASNTSLNLTRLSQGEMEQVSLGVTSNPTLKLNSSRANLEISDYTHSNGIHGAGPESPKVWSAKLTKTRSEGDIREVSEIRNLIIEATNPQLQSDFTIPKGKSYTVENALKIGRYSKHFKLSEPIINQIPAKHPTSGTFNDLTEWSTFFPESKFVRDFLFGFHILKKTCEQFLESIRLSWRYCRKKKRENENDMKERYYCLFAHWILYWGCYKTDFNENFKITFVKVAETILKDHENGRSIENLKSLLSNRSVLESKPGFLPVEPSFFPVRRAKSTQRYKLKSTAISLAQEQYSFCDLMIYDPKLIAEQLTLMEIQLFKEISITEFLQKENNLQTSDNLNNLSTHFNRISLWVATAIITTASPKKQMSLIKLFITVAKKLFKIRNYSSCCQIISGLQNISVSRLRNLVLAPKFHEELEKLQTALGPNDNYVNYRNLSRIPPYIPLLPVCLKDLTNFYENSEDYLDEEETIINCDKMQKIASIIYDLNIYSDVIQYPFFCDDELQKVINATIKYARDEDELYDLSLQIQPIVHK